MSTIMNALMMLMTAIVALIAIGIAVTNNRTVDRVEEVQSRTIESLTLSKNQLTDRIDKIIDSENTWHTHIEKELKSRDDEIDAITSKMAEFAKDCGRLDEMDTRIRIADAKGAEAQRLMILNGFSKKPNGVPWSAEYRCQDDQEEHHEQSV